MERVLGNMVILLQGTRTTGQAIPRNSDVSDRFQRLNPPIFRGKAGADPCKSEFWLEQIEKIFNFIGCDEVDKVGCATFMLRDKADQWWETMQRTLQDPEGQGTLGIAWVQFKEHFNTKYFPLCKKMEKGREFMNLK